MRKIIRIFGFLWIAVASANTAPRSAKPERLVFTHVNVIDGSGAPVQQDMSVVVKDGHVAELGRSGVSRDAYGKLKTRTVELRDGSSNLKIISAETRKSNQNQAVQVFGH